MLETEEEIKHPDAISNMQYIKLQIISAEMLKLIWINGQRKDMQRGFPK